MTTPPLPRPPLSVTIIGVLWLFAAIGPLTDLISGIGLSTRFLGFQFSGWSAFLFLLGQGVLGLCLGVGLLCLSELARKLTIGILAIYLALASVDTAQFLLEMVLGYPELETTLSSVYASVASEKIGSEWVKKVLAIMLGNVAILAAQLWFLITRRSAFGQSAR